MKTPPLGILYLIPISIGESPIERYQPKYNLDLIAGMEAFVVENIKTARRYIKHISPSRDLERVKIWQIDKHDDYSFPHEAIEWIQAGKDVGLMSEAGCPAVADPGSNLISKVHQMGTRIVPLVGPCSILLALMGSGFNGQQFCFHGYLPFSPSQRKSLFDNLIRRCQQGETQIFIEAPYRNDKLLQELIRTLPSHLRLCVAADLTTDREEIISLPMPAWRRASLPDLHKRPTIFLLSK